MTQINRTGVVHFHDASLSVWEEGLNPQMTWNQREAWEVEFKRDVFKRIIQTLNRLGWTVGPQTHIFTRNNARHARKGDLQADLLLQGRHIELKMFQALNCPTRPDNDGRYEHDKESVMPYMMRLEMERTRRRIRDYLCNVFSGYTFKPYERNPYYFPLDRTALERIQDHYAESRHFKGDLSKYEIADYNRRSAGGKKLEHGQRVWFFDSVSGRCKEGIAYFNINNMWWVAMGRYGLKNLCSSNLWTFCPPNPRVKRNVARRRQRLEGLMADAVKSMNFERAAQLRDILNPTGEPLYMIQDKETGNYFAPNYRGYRREAVDAGKYTRAELRPYLRGSMETDIHRAVAVA